PDALLEAGPLVISNAGELRLTGLSASALLERGAEAVIVTHGPDGVTVITAHAELPIAGENAGPVVDSTGAGDAFCGALAALLAEDLDLPTAARMANAGPGSGVGGAGGWGGLGRCQV